MDNTKLENILKGVKHDELESTVNYLLSLNKTQINKIYYDDIDKLLSSICQVKKFSKDNQIDELMNFLRRVN